MQAQEPTIGKYNLEIKRGDTFTRTLTCVSVDEGTGAESPVDFSGCTFRAQIRLNSESATVLATLTVTESAGVISLGLAAATTAALPIPAVRRAVWDLEITFPGGIVQTWIEGDVVLSGDVSRS